MKYVISIITFIITFSILSSVRAEECVPPPGGKCLTEEQLNKVKEALKELDSIKKSEMKVDISRPVVIIRDWDGRVYVNGGEKKPVEMRVTVGTIDRTLAVEYPTVIYYRTKPPDPMFRLRIRAQAGALMPDVWKKKEDRSYVDGGVGFDFFHLGPLNLDLYAGILSLGPGLGLDITRNFGARVGYSLVYKDLHSAVFTGAYFSFNLWRRKLNFMLFQK